MFHIQRCILALFLLGQATAAAFQVTKTSSCSGRNNRTKIHSSQNENLLANSFDEVVNSRYACTRFHRNDETTSDPDHPSASKSNDDIVKDALKCLDLSRRSPSGFNAQPYKLLMVHSASSKEKLAKFCLGRNADRIRDSDCTAVFLADKQCLKEYKRFGTFLDANAAAGGKRKVVGKWAKRKIQVLILLFSSGWPLPRFLSNPISFGVRTGVSTVSALTKRRVLVPSLGSAETWASKNTMLVAMTYMLACSSRGIATCPMEGYNVGGIRKMLKIPKRYAIPLIVSSGVPYKRDDEEGVDDVGMDHGPSASGSLTTRYNMDEIVFEDQFGDSGKPS